MSKFPTEEVMIPQDIHKKGLIRAFRYMGRSMTPTFKAGQVLYVRPDVQDVKAGDIVVYKHDGRYIVHRVLMVGKDGYITRGDNNLYNDARPVTREQMIGRVEMEEQRGEINLVRGGWFGLHLTHLSRVIRDLVWRLRNVFGWPYRMLKASGLVASVWRPEITRIKLRTVDGSLVKYIFRNKTVAMWDAHSNCFECRKPFDLIIPHP
jgi:signal peptidase I